MGIVPQPTASHRLRDHAFELATMVAWALVGVALMTSPSIALRSPVGREVGAWAYVWALLYLAGGPLNVAALFAGSSRWRVVGLLLVGTGLMMQGTAAMLFAFDWRTGGYFLFAAACLLRAYAIARFVTARTCR